MSSEERTGKETAVENKRKETTNQLHNLHHLSRPGVMLGYTLAVLLIGFLVAIFFVGDFHVMPEPLPAVTDSVRVEGLEAQITALQGRLGQNASGTAASVPEALQQQKLLDEIRAELKLAEERSREAGEVLREATEMERQTRAAGAVFLSAFALIAAVIAGFGYYKILGWREQADEYMQRLKEVEPDLEAIRNARDSLEDKLPAFLERAREELQQNNDPQDRKQLALMHEVEHLTYLGNVPFRFSKVREDKAARNYKESLLASARAHVAQGTYAHTIRIADEFFTLVPDFRAVITDEDRARMYSLRALAKHLGVREYGRSHSWIRKERPQKATDLRTEAMTDVKRALKADPDLDHAIFVEALLYSVAFVTDDEPDPHRGRFLSGQGKAVENYRKIIERKGWLANAARQNLACCLKRIYDSTEKQEDFEKFTAAVSSFPDDMELSFDAGASQSEFYKFLWQNMLEDAELFEKAKDADRARYTDFWHGCLPNKIKLRDWEKDVEELRESNPEMNSWVIRL